MQLNAQQAQQITAILQNLEQAVIAGQAPQSLASTAFQYGEVAKDFIQLAQEAASASAVAPEAMDCGVGDAELAKAIAEGLSEQALSVVTEELAMKRGSPRSFEGTRTISQESQ